MFIFLLGSFFLLIYLFLDENKFREGVLRGSIAFGAILLFVTEVLSAFSFVNFISISGAWITIFILLSLPALRKKPRIRFEWTTSFLRYSGAWWGTTWILFVLLITFLIAIVAPPNTWDSMTYHMARVGYWIQNETVSHFPTQNTRQIFMNPWSEYAILHLQVLNCGSDRMANLVQWAGFLGVITGVSLIAEQLGGSRKSQWLASLIAATTPMAILQASSTQTDLICSYWIVCVAWFSFLILGKERALDKNDWIFLGLSLALALATKGTAYIFCAPFILLSLVALHSRAGILPVAKGIATIGFLVMVLNGPHYIRNFQTFGNPLGDNASINALGNERHGPGVLISNVIRNLSLHFQTPSEAVNAVLEDGVRKIHDVLGMDSQDVKTTWGGRFHLPTHVLHEDVAGNLVLLCLGVVSALISLRLKHNRKLKLYFHSIIFGFLTISFVFKWQVWGARLQLPFFILVAPFCSVVISTFYSKYVVLVSCLLCISALPWVLLNSSRPLLFLETNKHKSILQNSRKSLYFVNQPDLEDPFERSINYLGSIQCNKIGVAANLDSWEYPLFGLYELMGYESRLAYYHLTKNESGNPLETCAILAIDQGASWKPPSPFNRWRKGVNSSRISIFVPAESP